MPTLFLTKEQIVETTGIEKLEEIEDLEILFLTFEEIASLDSCRRLRRLCCIDNGLRKISNLQNVSSSLQTLCLCDQSITAVENLFLPKLKELFLHRNQITTITSLTGCPRLQKLWLFQNQLTSASIQPLFHNLPDLEELWLQGNLITTLQGFDTFPKLRKLGLAGNPIRHYEELQPLSSLIYLQDISFNDFHFGRCPIVEDYQQYKNFSLLYLKQVSIIDGVKVGQEHRQRAEGSYYEEMKSFMNELSEIDHDYYKAMKDIELEFQSRESYTTVLEKEMSTALKDLHGLVDEGRNIVAKEVQKSKILIDNNYKSLKSRLEEYESKAQEMIEEQLYLVAENYQMMINILHLLELTDKNQSSLQQTLIAVVQHYQELQQQSEQLVTADKNRLFTVPSKKTLITEAPKFAFQNVNNNTAEFHLLSCCIDPSMMQVYSLGKTDPSSDGGDSSLKPSSSSGLPKRNRSDASNSIAVKDDRSMDQLDIPLLELAKLYKIAMYPRPFPINNNSTSSSALTASDFQRVYCILSVAELKILLTQGWRGLKQYYNSSSSSTSPNLSFGKVCQVFSNDASLLSHMFVEHETIQQFNKVPTSAEDPFGSNGGQSAVYWEQSTDSLTEIMKNIIKHSLQKTQKNSTPGKKVAPVVPDLLGRIFVFVSFQVSLRQLGLTTSSSSNLSPVVTSLQVPVLPVQRVQMMKELEISSPPPPLSSSAKESSAKFHSDAINGGGNSYRVIVARNRNSDELRTLNQHLNLLPNGSTAISTPRSEEDSYSQSKQSSGFISGVKPLEQSLFYSLPLDYCDSLLYLDFVALCVSHLPYNAPTAPNPPNQAQKPPVQILKHLEAKLLSLTMPTTQTDDAAKIITEFETNAKEEVKRYIERLMEGIEESEARELQKADDEVRYRESSMRHLRDEIEKERRSQEIQLRELKAYVSGGSSSHTNSDTNIGLASNPSNPKLLSNNKNQRR